MSDHEEHERHPATDGEVTATADAERQGESTVDGDGGTTEMRRLRERVRELERRNERLESAVAAFEHDFCGALTVASNHVEMARDDLPESHFGPIERAHDRMEAMAGELHGVVDGDDAGSLGPVPLAGIAEECWAGVDAHGAELVVETDATLVADHTRLLRLFENLFRNAVEHGSTSSRPGADDAVEHGSTSPPSHAREDAAEHGSTDGRLPDGDGAAAGTRTDDPGGRAITEPTVTVGALEDGFYVADDGPGIPAAERDRVFEEGYATSDGGTGLGLSIVRRVAAEHGWTVEVTESADGGARFEVTGVELRSGP